MILTTILLVVAAILAIALIISIATGGVILVGLFGDLIVCVVVIGLITKLFKRKKRK